MKDDKTRAAVRRKRQGVSADGAGELNFAGLVDSIRAVHEELSRHAAKAVNISLTVQNWLIGFYIREYEQRGSDRAKYGENLLERVAERLQQQGVERTEARELRRYRLFYVTYPQIREPATPELQVEGKKLLQSLSCTHLAALLDIDDPLKRVFWRAWIIGCSCPSTNSSSPASKNCGAS